MVERMRIDVPVVLDGAERGIIAARVIPPVPTPAQRLRAPVWLFCHPGSSGTWRYFDLEVPGRDGYSFAAFMAERGFGTVAIDTFGTGDSRFDGHGSELTLETFGVANHQVTCELRERLRKGTLVDDVPPLGSVSLCGVGHSGGGGVSIVQQATQRSFDYLAVLGMPADDFEVHGGADGVVAEFEMDSEGFMITPRMTANQRARGYLDDVPDDVVDARPRVRTPPSYPTVMRRGTLLPYAERIDVPAFVAFGEVDYGGTPFEEPGRYALARDVTVYIQPGSAHWHNQSTTRDELWTVLANWLWGRESFRDGRRPATAPR